MATRSPRRIAVVVHPQFQLLDGAGPLQVFATANEQVVDAGIAAPYRVELISARGGLVASSSGVQVQTAPLPRPTALRGGTVVVAGGYGIDAALRDPKLVEWLPRAAASAARCASVCTGAFVLAHCGLLRGKTAVTHWRETDALRRRFPDVRVMDDALFVRDGGVYSSAGVTAGIDLALALVEEDLGRALSLRVAKQLVVHLKRPGGQRQFSAELLAQEGPAGGVAERLTQWLKPRVARAVTIEQMADALALSPRTLHRRLREELAITPAKLLFRLRLDVACRLLETRGAALKRVAQQSGFGSEYNLRRAFAQALKVTPSAYRARFCRAPRAA